MFCIFQQFFYKTFRNILKHKQKPKGSCVSKYEVDVLPNPSGLENTQSEGGGRYDKVQQNCVK